MTRRGRRRCGQKSAAEEARRAGSPHANGDFTVTSDDSTHILDLGAGAISLGTADGTTRTITVNSTTLTLGGTISNGTTADSLALAGDGYGKLVLTGANTYTGDTTVGAGTLAIAHATLATASTVSVASGAVLELDFAGSNTVANLVLNGVSQPPGVYDSTTAAPFITGTGSLVVTPVLIGCGPLTGTSFPLTFTGPSGQSYEVLSSTNVALPLSLWTTQCSGTFPCSPVTYTDTHATNAHQFYRIQCP